MNKLIIGGVLVTVVGGTPTITYFLTRKENTDESISSVPAKEPRVEASSCSGDDCSHQTVETTASGQKNN